MMNGKFSLTEVAFLIQTQNNKHTITEYDIELHAKNLRLTACEVGLYISRTIFIGTK
jgi:hypothetical protein